MAKKKTPPGMSPSGAIRGSMPSRAFTAGPKPLKPAPTALGPRPLKPGPDRLKKGPQPHPMTVAAKKFPGMPNDQQTVVPGGTQKAAAGSMNLKGTEPGGTVQRGPAKGRDPLTNQQRDIVQRGKRAIKKAGYTYAPATRRLRRGIQQEGTTRRERAGIKVAKQAIAKVKSKKAAKKWSRRYRRAQG